MEISLAKPCEIIDGRKCYNPDETLVRFLIEWLQLRKKKEELAKEGKDLSQDDKKKIRESDRMKVYILDTIVFPAMTNLIFFFELVAANQKLSDAFEYDLVELLGHQNIKTAVQSSANDIRFSSEQFMENSLSRLIRSILSMHQNPSEYRKPATDFRLGIMYQIQNIIGDMMDKVLTNEYSTSSHIWKSAMEDYGRVKGWLALLARTAKEYPGEYDRVIGSYTINVQRD